MTAIRYCTPEWLEAMGNAFRTNPEYEEKLKKLSVKVCWLIKASPEWGIESDIIFATFITQGRMDKIGFISKEDAFKESEFILAASPQQWKKLLRRQSKFLGDFMLGKVTLDHGSRVAILSLLPYTDIVMDLLTEVELQYPDEMTAEELAEYREGIKKFRAELNV
jgi:hypothetical protein